MNGNMKIGNGLRLAVSLLAVSLMGIQEARGTITHVEVPNTKIRTRSVVYLSEEKMNVRIPRIFPNGSAIAQPKVNSVPAYDFSNPLPGAWDEVSGYVCFPYNDPAFGDTYITIIGLPVTAQGNETYQSTGWEKKVFWMNIGDGIPMHVAGLCYSNLAEESTGYNIYYSETFYYRKAGVDYSQYPMGGQFCVLWLLTDENNRVTEYWIDLYDEDDALVEQSVQIQPGDRIQSWTYSIDVDNPEVFYLATMEDGFRTVKSAPVFSYSHLTPNVDFPNALTKEKIDFPNVDLVYILRGRTIDAEGIAQYGTSAPKPLSMKWENLDMVQIENWLLHEISPQFGEFGRKY